LTHDSPPPSSDPASFPPPRLLVRCGVGGLFMGLANLVPGISGGTMLVVTGVFREFVSGVADLTSLRLRPRPIGVLAAIVGTAIVAIALLAGTVKGLVLDHRWVMYSLFIGWTLGGVPSVWRMARPLSPGVVAATIAGLLAMVGTFIVKPAGASPVADSEAYLFAGGLLAAAAMVLPGISGGYLLLLMGLYVPILDAIDAFKTAVLGRDFDAAARTLWVIVPVGLGVVGGVVGISHLVKWLLARWERPTSGVLLGLILGAFLGLYPFQVGVEPRPGQVVKGRVMTPDLIALLGKKDWPVEFFGPTPGQVVGALVLIAAATLMTLGLARLSNRLESRRDGATPPPPGSEPA